MQDFEKRLHILTEKHETHYKNLVSEVKAVRSEPAVAEMRAKNSFLKPLLLFAPLILIFAGFYIFEDASVTGHISADYPAYTPFLFSAAFVVYALFLFIYVRTRSRQRPIA